MSNKHGGRSLLGDAPGNQPGGFGGGNQGNWDDPRKNDYNEPAFSNEPNQFNQGNSFNGPRQQGFNGSGFNGNGPQRGGFSGGDRGFSGGEHGFSGEERGFSGGRGGFSERGGRGGFGDRGGRGGFRGGRGGFSGPGGPMDRSGAAAMMARDGPEPGAVLVVYGLAEGKFNCDKIFNLFCCYGNVMRIKILMSKEGGCMVNMGDRAGCERVVMNLNHSYIYDKKFSVAFSKQDFVKIHPQPSKLDDGTPSQKDYSETRNNRFFGPESVLKTRFSPPTKVLHFFNAPHTVTDSDFKDVFSKAGADEPVRVRIFPVKTGARSAAGLIEFAGPNEATAALITANHTVMPNKSGRGPPYSLKLAFSASPILDKPGYDDTPSKKSD